MFVFISNVRHEIEGLFDYDHKLNSMPDVKVSLPFIDNDIAFDYMEKYIEEVKRIHIRMKKDGFSQTLKKYQTFLKEEI